MKKRWITYPKTMDYDEIGRTMKISPQIVRLMADRGVSTPDEMRKYLYGDENDLYNPALMKDLVKAADIILDCVNKNEKIAISGDYDVDGVMSSFILKRGLEELGAQCKVFVPHRVKEGYGIRDRIVDEAKAYGAGLIITCDNGISEFEVISRAKEMGLKVIVTDHHEVKFEDNKDGSRRYLYVDADAIVDPKQPDCQYPFKKLCGAGVTLKLISYLLDWQQLSSEKKLELKRELIVYAAIATVTDVMELQDENRIIVRTGLKHIRNIKNKGLNALIEHNDLDKNHLTSYHIGFVIGPCFNAAGRLDTALMALNLLNENDPEKADAMAAELKELNESRKDMTNQGIEQAIECIESSDLRNDKIIVLLLENCHESIAGLVAGKVKEAYNRPAIVFTRIGEGLVKGSGRSIEEYNMFAELSCFKDMMTRFGGHPMAAGMTLKEEELESFRKKVNANTKLTDRDLIPKIYIDFGMGISYITYEFIDSLSVLEPCGHGNKKPVFWAENLEIANLYVLGKDRNTLKLRLRDKQGYTVDAIGFRMVDSFGQFIEEEFGKAQKELLFSNRANNMRIDLIFYPDINEYNGTTSIQLKILDYRRSK